MVKFKIGYNRYDADEAVSPLVEKLVQNLNDVFGNNKCPIHAYEKWDIEVDLMKNGHLQFTSTKQNGCSYPEILVESDISHFLVGYGIFPLPSH